MIPWWWSWLLTAWGIAGLVLAGRKRAVGWAVGLTAQLAWIAYAVTTEQWGFIASALSYGAVYAVNWRAWTRTARVRQATQDADTADWEARKGARGSRAIGDSP